MSADAQVPVRCRTSKGPIDIVLQPKWSPIGAERFQALVSGGFFKKVPLFRCVEGFLCQFGYKPMESNESEWPTIQDDTRSEVTPKRFKRGYISFAGNGKNSRSSHLFVTLGENVSSLGREPWETPIGYITEESMENVVSKWTTKYGDMPPWCVLLFPRHFSTSLKLTFKIGETVPIQER